MNTTCYAEPRRRKVEINLNCMGVQTAVMSELVGALHEGVGLFRIS
jgi:hypothetical protein